MFFLRDRLQTSLLRLSEFCITRDWQKEKSRDSPPKFLIFTCFLFTLMKSLPPLFRNIGQDNCLYTFQSHFNCDNTGFCLKINQPFHSSLQGLI